MIVSKPDTENALFRHTVSGDVSLSDLVEAIYCTEQAEHLPVLWDLREAEELIVADKQQDSLLIEHIRQNITPRLSSFPRAFVIGKDEQAVQVELLLSVIRAPWPWLVFDDPNSAISWLSHSNKQVSAGK